MFDFGDELIIDSYRIPWLIWIQLIVMLLLILLLYSLSSSPSDLSLLSSATATATDPSTSSAANRPSLPTATATTLLHSKARGNQVKETATSTSKGGGRRAGKEDIRKRDDVGSSTKDAGHGLVYGESYHPCNFLDLAKQAFLKCLGLDSSSDNPSRRKHGKDS